ncbi:MAG: hypothetical protein AAF672_17115 [Pseudomonadota bacterium]
MSASSSSDTFGLILAAGLVALCVGIFAVNTSQAHDALPKTPFGINAMSLETERAGAALSRRPTQDLPQIGRS